MFSKKFYVDNLLYEVSITESSVISFRLVSGLTKTNTFKYRNNLFNDDNDSYLDLNISSSPFQVFNKVKDIVVSWIKGNSPEQFSFSSSTDRKSKIYDRMVDRNINNDVYFSEKYYKYKFDDDSYVFYKRK